MHIGQRDAVPSPPISEAHLMRGAEAVRMLLKSDVLWIVCKVEMTTAWQILLNATALVWGAPEPVQYR